MVTVTFQKLREREREREAVGANPLLYEILCRSRTAIRQGMPRQLRSVELGAPGTEREPTCPPQTETTRTCCTWPPALAIARGVRGALQCKLIPARNQPSQKTLSSKNCPPLDQNRVLEVHSPPSSLALVVGRPPWYAAGEHTSPTSLSHLPPHDPDAGGCPLHPAGDSHGLPAL